MMRVHLKRLLRRLGVEVSRYRPENSRVARSKARLDWMGVDLVLDVGANVGQYATELREGGYSGRIISFEPQQDAHARLAAASRNDPDWSVYERCAIGAEAGEARLQVSKNSWSSSLKEITDCHLAAAPDSRFVGAEIVPVRTLDQVAIEAVRAAKCPYLKIDTQGYEKEVLLGALETLPLLVGMQLELSLVPLYNEQPDFLELIGNLLNSGFELFSLEPEFVDPLTGRLLQVDGVFYRSGLTRS
jgi:FkbM family methyltransferase